MKTIDLKAIAASETYNFAIVISGRRYDSEGGTGLGQDEGFGKLGGDVSVQVDTGYEVLSKELHKYIVFAVGRWFLSGGTNECDVSIIDIPG